MNWLTYFQHNRDHRRDIPWEAPNQIAPRLLEAFAHSLQRFQLGESGEGLHLRRHAAQTGNREYEECIHLFIKEEQEHSRLMAGILQRLNAPLLPHHWSDVCFMLLRRYLGLTGELLVLMVAEMIAKRYFRALHDGINDPALQAVCAQILHDEEGHVAFHVDTLQRTFATRPWWQSAVVRAGWRVLFRAGCLVVMWDHRAILRATGVSPAIFWWDCGLIFDEIAALIFNPAGASIHSQWRRVAERAAEPA